MTFHQGVTEISLSRGKGREEKKTKTMNHKKTQKATDAGAEAEKRKCALVGSSVSTQALLLDPLWR